MNKKYLLHYTHLLCSVTSVFTFRAFVFYLHTGIVNFKPLKSSIGKDDVPDQVLVKTVNPWIHTCSPSEAARILKI